jgi:phosphinothricin acetyltransferase
MQILFVPMTESDIELMLPLYNHYVRETTATFREDEVNAETIKPILFPEGPRFGSWKIVVDGRPCGYTTLRRHRTNRAWETCAEVTVFLDPAWPGKGVGSQALAFVEYRAKERDFHTLLAYICSENTSTVRTFLKAGYTECAHYPEAARKFGRWLDVLGFVKKL